ncbi:MAG: sigma 54-interacting transcriptional regulator [Tepidanaerobacter acetatoxydans]|uniref:sigma 54-interacting transcriptional regulator n=1 Tax=Tepidanaerobacter acetatoxydans TaxID=499229 RepID=UPI0026EE91C1|nr:sigma-54-dependent transcriptional regulator [Tepidanaerobacter acetatoxydans]NLU11112.1 sigma 54-interacting transcriptional regulator [Tepidanaerobacter acetatoxydans]
MLKDRLIIYLEEQTKSCDLTNITDMANDFTAEKMAKRFNVKRNTVSYHLNNAVREKILFKINTRPVIFFHRIAFQEKFFSIPLDVDVYESITELMREKSSGNTNIAHKKLLPKEAPEKVTHKNAFSDIIGAKGSLKKTIEQIKTSVFYPDNGLPILLYGPTGVGKSWIAKKIYQFATENGVIKKDAPFVSFNCAQYANNPELLSSNLFGYAKGAFTGAYTTTRGMLESADEGILFLDEVHRLNQEGQEKLFTFLDQGVFRRMGETEGWHTAKVRLIMATTEDLSANFLETFLRRIPIIVNIPSLDERGIDEKLQFVYSFLIEESRILGKDLLVSTKVVDTLISHTYKGNIGSLQNIIKYMCASNYAKDKENEEIHINLYNLPEELLIEVSHNLESKIKKNNVIRITPNTSLNQIYSDKKDERQMIKSMFAHCYEFYTDLKEGRKSQEQFENDVFNEINALFDYLVFKRLSDNEGTMMKFITGSMHDVFRYVEYNYNMNFNGNSIYAISTYLFFRHNEYDDSKEADCKICAELYEYILQNYKFENKIAKHMLLMIESKMDIRPNIEDEILFTLYLKSQHIKTDLNHIKAIILAHGYATASSIANVANRLLNENIFEAFDMPIDSRVEDIVEHVRQYVEYNDIHNGLVMLVDMGSLNNIYLSLKQYLSGPVAIINNVSTQLALSVGSQLKKGLPIEDMIEEIKMYNQTEYKVIYPERDRQKAFLTCCFTGLGTAEQLKNLLEKSIPSELNLKIAAYDFQRLKSRGIDDPIFQLYDVLCIIGTADPKINRVEFINIEDLMSGEAESRFIQILKPIATDKQINNINENLIRNFSIERLIDSLTILDTNKILSHIGQCLGRYESLSGKHLSNRKKAGIYFHVSCLVERLVRQSPIEIYPDLENLQKSQSQSIKWIQEAFSTIEEVYSVKIPPAEIGYIYDILVAED